MGDGETGETRDELRRAGSRIRAVRLADVVRMLLAAGALVGVYVDMREQIVSARDLAMSNREAISLLRVQQRADRAEVLGELRELRRDLHLRDRERF